MNQIEIRLAQAASLQSIQAGETINLPVDLLLVHDGTAQKFLDAIPSIFTPALRGSQVVITIDHGIPAPTTAFRALHLKVRDFCRKHGFTLYERGEGIMHQVVAEHHTPIPGQVIVGADGHVLTSTAFGALCFSENGPNAAEVLQTGLYQLTVPETVTVSFTGKATPNITAKDLSLSLLQEFGLDGLRNRLLLVHGEAITKLSPAAKMTFCNIFGELGVTCAHITEDLSGIDDKSIHTIAADDLSPLVAAPPDPSHILNVASLPTVKPTMVVIGGCTNGRIEDMAAVAEILTHKTVHQDICLMVLPASRIVSNLMDTAGYSSTIRAAGGIITSPGCGSCSGIHQGVACADDIVVTTTVRNTPGRMGAKEARIYLVSPETAAQTAITGHLTAIGA